MAPSEVLFQLADRPRPKVHPICGTATSWRAINPLAPPSGPPLYLPHSPPSSSDTPLEYDIMGQKEDPAVANHVSGQSNSPISRPPHVLPFDKVIQELQTDSDEGLSPQEAEKRLEKYGRNEFGEAKGVQPLRILGAQLANAMTLVSIIPLPLPTPLHPVCGSSLLLIFYRRQSSGFARNRRLGRLGDANDVIATQPLIPTRMCRFSSWPWPRRLVSDPILKVVSSLPSLLSTSPSAPSRSSGRPRPWTHSALSAPQPRALCGTARPWSFRP